MAVTDTPTPTSMEEFAEILSERPDIAGEGGDPAALAAMVQAVIDETTKNDPDIQAQVAEQFEQRFGELIREDPDLKKALARPPLAEQATTPRYDPRVFNAKAVGNQGDMTKLGFADVGEFLEMCHHWRKDGPREASKWAPQAKAIRDIQAAYSSEIPAEGGFLIPEEFRATLMSTVLEGEIIRPRATVIPMSSRTIRIPFVDDKDRTSSTHGGIITYWKKEAGQLTASNAEFGAKELIAKKHTAYSELPNELPADATGFAAFFAQAYPEAMAWGRDVGFWEGDGTNEPNGILHSSNGALVSATRAAGSNIAYADILGIYKRMLPECIARSVWVANLDTFQELMEMELSTGSPAVFHSTLPDSPPMRLLGRPLILTEKVPGLGSAGDIGLYDFSQYLVGDRQAMSVATSTEFKFDTDQLAFRIIERLDGAPWMNSAVTPRNGANTLSPFVRLAA